MDKNTIIAIGLSTLVIIAGFTLQAKFFPTNVESPQLSENSLIEDKTTIENNSSINVSAKSSPIAVTAESEEQNALVEEFSIITTNLVEVKFTNRGGDILSYKLKGRSEQQESIEMAEFVTEKNRAFSLYFGDSKGIVIDQLFNVKRINENTIGFYRLFTVQNSDGTQSKFTLAKQYTFFPDDYMFELKVTIDGDENFKGIQIGKAGYTLQTAPQIGPKWSGKQDQYEYRKFIHLLNDKKKIITLKPNQTKEINEKVTWTGVAGKYFTLIALPEAPIDSVLYSTIENEKDEANAQIFITRSPINEMSTTDSWKFYLGPRTEKSLRKYSIGNNNPYNLTDAKLDQIVESSGILGPLEFILKWCMEFFYKIIPNWGISIIILTLLMRIILFPLTKKSTQATVKMQELQPKIQEIQTKYKDNTQKMNEEMAKFYKTAGYNPLSGCLPLLIQFPLIFAMYNLFNNYFEFRGAMFIPGWIPDLSKGDSIMKLALTVPVVGWQLTNLRLLPVIYVISQLLYGKVTQTPGAAQQNSSMKFMMYGMPLIFFFIFYDAPAGLLIYWIFSNILTLGQQVIINKLMHRKKNNGLQLVKK